MIPFRVTIPYTESAHPGKVFTIVIQVEASDPEHAKKEALGVFESHENNVFASWVREAILENIAVDPA